jgi:dTDP-glucose 4,6-dehydratase
MQGERRSMKIIVTGGAGFIGSAMCRYLVGTLGLSVLNLDKLTYAANPASLASIEHLPTYEFERADICDSSAMQAAFARFRPDAVIHLAAESHVDRSIAGSDAFLRTNVLGTYTLLEVARSYWSGLETSAQAQFRFLHVSTDEVFGSLEAVGLFHENSPYAPSSPYAATKAAADHLANAWHRTYGLPVLISNCSNNFGPCQFPEKLIPLTILNALEGKPLPVYGDGMNVRDWLYVDDHTHALFLILKRGKPGRSYNVGGRNERANTDVVTQICHLLDRYAPSGAPHRSLMTYVADRPGHDRRYGIDPTRLETELGWQANENFESGLDKTVRWYLANEEWWRPLRGKASSSTDRPPASIHAVREEKK